MAADQHGIDSLEELDEYLSPFFYKDIVLPYQEACKYQWGNDEFYKKDEGMVLAKNIMHLLSQMKP